MMNGGCLVVVVGVVCLMIGGMLRDVEAKDTCEASNGKQGDCNEVKRSGKYKVPNNDDSSASDEEGLFKSFIHHDPQADYNKIGISFAQKGEFEKALEYFRAAAHHSPHRGDVWSNVGLVYKDIAFNLHEGSKKTQMVLLREAIAALELAVFLENKSAKNILEAVRKDFRSMFPHACMSVDCERFKLEKGALQLLEKNTVGDTIAAVAKLCKNEKSVVVPLRTADLNGPLSAHTARRLYITMRVCGVAVLRNAMEKSVLKKIIKVYEDRFESFSSRLAKWDHKGVLEWTDAASRSEDRYEIKFKVEPPFTYPDVTANRFILFVSKLMLGDRIEIDTLSTVTSLPGAPNQHWHADVGSIFKRHIRSPDRHLPPTGVVIIVPLVDVTADNGPTEFMTGSHISLGFDYWHELNEKNCPTSIIRPEARMGDVVIFDLRNHHRGTANNSNSKRPIMYMSYVEDWYFDKVNFKDTQSREYDSLSFQQKKLFGRLDHLEYVRKLEQLLTERGADLSEYQSQGGYKKVDLRA
eukprot:m.45393 g.45393  ORF g.45393 m.45393 type:complete len:524 (-) comp7217_c0_seq1:140-1711(-)